MSNIFNLIELIMKLGIVYNLIIFEIIKCALDFFPNLIFLCHKIKPKR